jgi:hypothetical protein
MTEMIERVARAIYETMPAQIMRDDVWINWEWENIDPSARSMALYRARVAIEAMLEPTEAMLRAHHLYGVSSDPRDDWRHMIGAALKAPVTHD